jgi:glutamine synthetase
VTKINIESETAASIARTLLLPAAARHLTLLLGAQLTELAQETSELIDLFTDALAELEQRNLAESQPHDDLLEHARYMHDRVMPAMEAVRVAADALEKIVADDLWPLPKYSEILFIK